MNILKSLNSKLNGAEWTLLPNGVHSVTGLGLEAAVGLSGEHWCIAQAWEWTQQCCGMCWGEHSLAPRSVPSRGTQLYLKPLHQCQANLSSSFTKPKSPSALQPTTLHYKEDNYSHWWPILIIIKHKLSKRNTTRELAYNVFYWLAWEDPADCRWCHPWVLGAIRKSRLSKPWGISQWALFLHGLCLGSCLQVPALASLSDGLWCGAVTWNKLFPPQATFYNRNSKTNTIITK